MLTGSVETFDSPSTRTILPPETPADITILQSSRVGIVLSDYLLQLTVCRTNTQKTHKNNANARQNKSDRVAKSGLLLLERLRVIFLCEVWGANHL